MAKHTVKGTFLGKPFIVRDVDAFDMEEARHIVMTKLLKFEPVEGLGDRQVHDMLNLFKRKKQ